MNTSQLYDVLEKARVECGIVGMSVAVLYKGDLVFAEGFGKRNQQDPFTAEVYIYEGYLLPYDSLLYIYFSAGI